MATVMTTLTARAAYRALARHHEQIADIQLRDLFAADEMRGTRLTAEGAGLYLDYSKHRITDETVALLVALAEEAGLGERIEAMFRGDPINVTENRSVLHTALRRPRTETLIVDGRDVVADVHAVLDRMAEFAHGSVTGSGEATRTHRFATS
jgi:glucose-6-phosphate isomerase